MNKSKTAPQSPLAYWWNEFLFSRSFSFTTTLSPEDCQIALNDIAHPVEGGLFSFSRMSKTVEMSPLHGYDESSASFDIRVKRRNRGIDYTMAKAEGTIQADDTTGETLVQGRTKFGSTYYLFMVGYVAIFGLVFLSMKSVASEMPFYTVILLAVLAYTWWRMYTDRNRLTEDIQSTLYEAEHSANRAEKLKHGSGSINPALLGTDERGIFKNKR